MASLFCSVFVLLAITVSFDKAIALSILKSDSFVVGSNISLECSADAVDIDESVTDGIYNLILTRRTSREINKDHKMAIFYGLKYFLGDPTWSITSKPNDEQWDVTFPTDAMLENKKFKRSEMKLLVILKDVTCDDAGTYYCSVVYDGPVADLNAEGSQVINSTSLPSGMRLLTSPDYSVPGSFQSTYRANVSIEMTCTAEAPKDKDYKFFWSRKCPIKGNTFGFQPTPTFQTWPVQNDIKERQPVLIDGSCGGIYKHSQMLIFDMSEDLHECVVKCEFGLRFQSMSNLHSNFTFFLEGKEVTPGPVGDSPTTASNEDLIIGLTVSLLLVAIIVAAVLAYVCWWRKRKPSDKYKDEPDVGHEVNNGHAPPPVFYSKPNKPPKDEARGKKQLWNNDSRDCSYDQDDRDEVPPKAYYTNDGGEADYPEQTYSKRRSQRGSGDYYRYDDGDDGRRSTDTNPNPRTDRSRSEDESDTGHLKPQPKRRTKLPSIDPKEEKELHYADLDLTRKPRSADYREEEDNEDSHRGRYNRNRRNNRRSKRVEEEQELPVTYASIRV